ncbi:MAG: Asp-tRNA(Asn)/Glu-tRNA(Gln) amidotransferase subunit GatB [Saprospiraceae bacterium]|jgi:aspartyl-tRNA(Asn)/glutamyl-tRNA(Gln) amidotransferase subunit B|nr:Asp-tRNA(Asn)/Glu-tRNA(Gln) amidotransferase subunit GatB [Saprospiraceae bacterium]
MQYETVIGLEIHVQLLTQSKAFCSDTNEYASLPNTNISAISLAHPGTLPKMNQNHLDKAILLGLAFGSDIKPYSYFDRKNYFYPDLPKGYQITQDKAPYCTGGKISFLSEGNLKSIRLHHIHMEEDAGKSIHDLHEILTLVDINRAGVPLLEIVTEPDFRSGQEVSDFMAELQKAVKYLGISDGNMEEGSFRCDCNVSVMLKGATTYGERCEIKNMNSKRFAKLAIEYEAQRQIAVLKQGGTIHKTTMLYDPDANVTRPMRKKESENDYRYFPEPDLPPIMIANDYIFEISKQLVALPVQRHQTLRTQYQLSHADADLLTEELEWSNAFYALSAQINDYKDLAELFIHKVLPYLKSENKSLAELGDLTHLHQFVALLQSDKVSKSAAYQHIFPKWILDISQKPLNIAEELQLIKSDDQSFLDDLILNVINSFPDKVKEYQKGKKGLVGFFMGQVMQKSGGKADPKLLQTKMEHALNL